MLLLICSPSWLLSWTESPLPQVLMPFLEITCSSKLQNNTKVTFWEWVGTYQSSPGCFTWLRFPSFTIPSNTCWQCVWVYTRSLINMKLFDVLTVCCWRTPLQLNLISFLDHPRFGGAIKAIIFLLLTVFFRYSLWYQFCSRNDCIIRYLNIWNISYLKLTSIDVFQTLWVGLNPSSCKFLSHNSSSDK